ncbi:glycosyltransferase [bacterium]|nr:glycosyltransferase [bacterium]
MHKNIYLFCDTRFHKNNYYYSTGQFTSNCWSKYCKKKNKLHVYGKNWNNFNGSIDELNKHDIDNVKIFTPNKDTKYSKFKYILNTIKIIYRNKHFIIQGAGEYASMCALICILLKKKYLIEVNGCPYLSYKYYGTLFAKLYAPFKKYIYQFIVKKAYACHYVTEKYLQKKYPTKRTSIACNNFKISEIVLPKTDTSINTNQQMLNIGFVIMCPKPFKGINRIVEIINNINNNNIKFHIIGYNINEALNNHKIKPNLLNYVCYKPLTKDKFVNKWLRNIDVLLNLSYTEGISRTLLEAMYLKKFIISVNVSEHLRLLSKIQIIDEYSKDHIINRVNYIEKNRLFCKSEGLRNHEKIQLELIENKFEKLQKFYSMNV